MESVHLYFLLYQTHIKRPVSISLPRTLIKGYGFQQWTLMFTRRGILRFKHLSQERLLEVFVSEKVFPFSMIKTQKSSRLIKTEDLDLYNISSHSDIIIQEYMSCRGVHRVLSVRWNRSNKMVCHLRKKEKKGDSESPVSLGRWRPEISHVVSIIRQILEEYFSGYIFRTIQLSFAMDSARCWRLLQISSFKVDKKDPEKTKFCKLVSADSSPTHIRTKNGRFKHLSIVKSPGNLSHKKNIRNQRADLQLQELNQLVKTMQDVVYDHCVRDSRLFSPAFRKMLNSTSPKRISSNDSLSKNTSLGDNDNINLLRSSSKLNNSKPTFKRFTKNK